MERGIGTGPDDSTLVRALRRLALVDGEVAAPGAVDGLARWIDWTAAIPLSAALAEGERGSAPSARTPDPAALERELTRVQAELGAAIDAATTRAGADLRRPGPARRLDPDPVPASDAEVAALEQQRYRDLQRAMETAITPLRQRLRAALHEGTPAAARLAALDAALEQLLAPREKA